MAPQPRLDDNGMSTDGDVGIPVPFSRGSPLRSYPLQRPKSLAAMPDKTPPSPREAQVVRLPLFQSPAITQAAEQYGLSSEEVDVLDSVMHTFVGMGFRAIPSSELRFGTALVLQRPEHDGVSEVTVKIIRVAGPGGSAPTWRMIVSSSNNTHRLTGFAYELERFQVFALEYATRFQVDDVVPLNFDL